MPNTQYTTKYEMKCVAEDLSMVSSLKFHVWDIPNEGIQYLIVMYADVNSQ